MDLNPPGQYKKPFIIVSIVILMIFSLWMRLLPIEVVVGQDWINLLGNDPWYNLRQIEQTVANFPGYAWFDPMTHYPFGDNIYWGPLFIWIGSAAAIITGAASRVEIMYVASWIPPLMGALMVPVMYKIGERIYDWKTGIFSAFFISVMGGQYFYRSLFSFVDHHIAEVLFSTIFCLVYIWAIQESKKEKIDFSNYESIKRPMIVSAFAGIAYLLGYLTMPTMILFALIVAIYSAIQFFWDFHRGRGSEYLLMVNATVFLVAILGVLLFGFTTTSLSLSQYSIGHVIAYLMLIFAFIVLYAISVRFRGRSILWLLGVTAGIAIVVLAILGITGSGYFNLFVNGLISFFGQNPATETVQEAMAWNIDNAWQTYGFGWLLFAGGLIWLIYSNWKGERAESMFILVWSVIILLATWQHLRYQYYLGVNIALLSAVILGVLLDSSKDDLISLIHPEKTKSQKREQEKEQKSKKSKKRDASKEIKSKPQFSLLSALFILFAVVGLVFAVNSCMTNYEVGVYAGYGAMESDWKESLEWLGSNSPETGVDYYRIYDKDTFEYPPESYGVMSWWDYGHWITFVSERIPNANPFQRGVAGDVGAAAFFVTQSEDWAKHIADTLGVKYIMTDVLMDTGKFGPMATWFNRSAGITPYQEVFFTPVDTEGNLQSVTVYTPEYFGTMQSRLHNFDCSMAEPSTVMYIEYRDGDLYDLPYPLATNAAEMTYEEALAAVKQYNNNALPGYHAKIITPGIATAPVEVDALRYFRLIHESPSQGITGEYDIKYVKIFEYVQGAIIQGEGTIEADIVTNTGRTFTYSQKSKDGVFVVPYSSEGCPYETHATGNYRIIETGKEFSVSEKAVQQGLKI